MFSKKNFIRRICWNIIINDFFEGVILFIICVAALVLAIETYFLNNTDPTIEAVFYWIDIFFTIAFTTESVIKSISLGLILEPDSYLRDAWNILDFIIVVFSLIDLSLTQINIPMVKILRLLRIFRPLRFVSHNVNMRIMVAALFRSFGAICNTLLMVMMIWIMFSIVGVSFFAGKFQYCSVDTYVNNNPSDCVDNGGTWKTYDHNFDNTINGLIYLFELTTQENWPNTFLQATDCTDVGRGPVKDASWYYAYYYIVFLIVSSMFLLNLFAGVMFMNFAKLQDQANSFVGDIVVTEDQLNWIEVQKMIIRAEPNYNARTIPPALNWRKPVHQFVTSPPFEIFIAIIILLNMLDMAVLYDGASPEYILTLDIINYIFTGIFTLEAILKMISFAGNYWFDSWNVFDFFVVISSYIDIILSNVTSNSLTFLRVGPQLLRVMRILRVSRLLRLVKKYKRLQDIMEIIQLCLPSMMNVFALLFLVFFIYAVLGCYLFNNAPTGNFISDWFNFSNFGFAMMLLLKLATGEDWNFFMFDYARTSDNCAAGLGCGDIAAYLYFMSFKFAITFVMLNLFVLVVLQLFEKYFIQTDNIITKFKDDFEIFQENWQSLGTTQAGYMLSQNKLIRFFARIPEPLGMEGMEPNVMAKAIIDLGIRR